MSKKEGRVEKGYFWEDSQKAVSDLETSDQPKGLTVQRSSFLSCADGHWGRLDL
jgi:hypothetical protein